MSLPSETVKPKLAEFAAYARSLKGDEKGEAQLFLDRFFRALGHTGIKEAGATLEFRIAKKPGSAQLELITDQPVAKAKSAKGGKPTLFGESRVYLDVKKLIGEKGKTQNIPDGYLPRRTVSTISTTCWSG